MIEPIDTIIGNLTATAHSGEALAIVDTESLRRLLQALEIAVNAAWPVDRRIFLMLEEEAAHASAG